jgi:hypothetical protein
VNIDLTIKSVFIMTLDCCNLDFYEYASISLINKLDIIIYLLCTMHTNELQSVSYLTCSNLFFSKNNKLLLTIIMCSAVSSCLKLLQPLKDGEEQKDHLYS